MCVCIYIYIYIYIYVIYISPSHFAVHLKLTQHCKSTILQLKKKKRETYIVVLNKCVLRASLVAQWLRICLPMQETRVRALVWEDPTCRGATKPMCHNY